MDVADNMNPVTGQFFWLPILVLEGFVRLGAVFVRARQQIYGARPNRAHLKTGIGPYWTENSNYR